MDQPAGLGPSVPSRTGSVSRPGVCADLVRHFRLGEMLGLVCRHAARLDEYYLLNFNLALLTSNPPRKIGGGVFGPVGPDEFGSLRRLLPSLEARDRAELLARIRFFEKGFSHCYALRENGVICHLQWIAYPSDNALIVSAYGRRFAPLDSREVMIENAFTFPQFRGKGLLRHATWQLLKLAKDKGYLRAFTCARKENLAALNNLVQMGFRMQARLREIAIGGYPWRFWGKRRCAASPDPAPNP